MESGGNDLVNRSSSFLPAYRLKWVAFVFQSLDFNNFKYALISFSEVSSDTD